MTTATETKKPSPTPQDKRPAPLAVIVQGLEARREQFRAMLPAHITVEHFERVVMTAVNVDPELVTADRRSFYNACMRAASDGLLPDKREGALVAFKDRESGAKLVTWMPMVFGLIKKIRQSGEIEGIGARIVYQREIDEFSPSQPLRKRFEFIIEDGQEKLFHDPMLWGERGPKVLVYAYARFKGGYVQYMPVHRDDVLKRRKAARTDKIWTAWEDEMWLKTAIRAIAGRLPLSADIRTAVERDDTPTEFDRLRNAAMATLAAPVEEEGAVTEIIDAQTDAQTETPPPPAQSESETLPVEPAGLFQDESPVGQKTIGAEEFVKNAIEGLNEFSVVTDVEDYAQRMRHGLVVMQPPQEERRKLLSQLNRAVMERITALTPETRQ